MNINNSMTVLMNHFLWNFNKKSRKHYKVYIERIDLI